MHPNAQLIETFYTRLAQRDHAGMIACYAPEVTFNDPVFSLSGKRVGVMWHMLCEGGKDLRVTASDIWADDTSGRSHWEATYTFSATGRRVHNIIDATFELADGKIIRHKDRFPLWRWTRMALGTSGVLLGWTPMVQGKVRKTAAERLERFIAAHPEYQ